MAKTKRTGKKTKIATTVVLPPSEEIKVKTETSINANVLPNGIDILNEVKKPNELIVESGPIGAPGPTGPPGLAFASLPLPPAFLAAHAMPAPPPLVNTPLTKEIKTKPKIPTTKPKPEFEVLLPIPGDSLLVLIQTEPHFYINCVTPARKQQINVDYFKRPLGTEGVRSIEIDVPDLVWTQNFFNVGWEYKTHEAVINAWMPECPCFSCNFSKSFKNYAAVQNYRGSNWSFNVNAIDLSKSNGASAHTAYYDLANVDNSFICWGNNRWPRNLKEARNTYWQSVLNNSVNKYPVNNEEFKGCYQDKYTPEEIIKINDNLVRHISNFKPRHWTDYTFNNYRGSKYQTAYDSPFGVFISAKETTRIGFAYFKENKFQIKFEDSSEEREKANIEIF